jgi:mycothiol synthase
LTLTGLQHLRARGLTQVMLYVDADNLPARSVYERLGFTIWDEDVMFLQAAEPDLHFNVTP